MEAEQTAFRFIKDIELLEVPFFQRPYVWNEDNWEDLIESLLGGLDKKTGIFLGSIILKEQESNSEYKKYQVIDGQQRLTTLSI